MANNSRIHFGCESIGFSKLGSAVYVPGRGVQSAGITTNIQLTPVFQLGDLNLYENMELVPEVEFTAEKCLDGNPLLCHLATNGALAGSLVGRSNIRSTIALNVFGDTQTSASGTSIAEVNLSGTYWSSSTFSFPIEGTFRESFTAVGNDKQWRDIAGGTTMLFSGFFTGKEQPLALTSGSGGIQRRQDLIFYPIGQGYSTQEGSSSLDVNGQVDAFLTILPPQIAGISSSGTNDRDANGNFGCHVQSINISANLGRDSIFELGRMGPFFRYVAWPVEITTEIEILATKWDNVSVLSAGIYSTGPNMGNNVTNSSIRVRAREGTFINLGSNNKLQSVSYTGGDTGGGNVMVRYTYQTYNEMTISHPADPSALPFPY